MMTSLHTVTERDASAPAPRAPDDPPDDRAGPPPELDTAPAPRRREPLERLAPLLLGGAAVVMLPALALLIDRDAIGGFGLAGVLPVWAWCGIAAAVLACVTELLAPDPRTRVLTVLTGVLALCTTGLPAVVEPGARLGVSWTHLGFAEAIAGDGVVPLGVDSRFSWAGFFSQWAWISDAAGGLRLDVVVQWAPPVVAVLWAVGVYAIARRLLDGVRAPWVAAWLFLGLNWIEQDYFSPQATAFLLAVAVLVLVVQPLGTRRPALTDPADTPAARVRALVRPATWRPWSRLRSPHPSTESGQVLLAWGVASLLLVAMAVTHQLTPVALLAQLVVLTIAGRVWGGRGLIVVLGLAVLAWIVLGGREFWLHQLTLALGDVGDAGGSVSRALTERVVGDPGQMVVKLARVLMAGATVALAAVGAWIRWRRGGDVVWLVAALVPGGIVLVQSYGGEALLRILLYALPLCAILGVDALRAFVRRLPRIGRPLLAVGMVVLFALLVTIRGGNDAYVALRPQEVAMAREVLASAPIGSTVLPISSQAPTHVSRVGEVFQVTTACDTLMEDPVGCTLADRPYAVYSLPTMDAHGAVLEGRPPGWTRAAMDAIVATGQYRLVHAEGLYSVVVRNDPGAR